MHASLTSTDLTVGKLLGLAFGLYRAHSGILLGTAAIFYVPVAALSFFVVESNASDILFNIVVWPIEAFASLSLIAHCVDLLHGRPLAIRTAVGRGLRRLPAGIGMMLAMTAIFGGVALVAAIPIWVDSSMLTFPSLKFATRLLIWLVAATSQGSIVYLANSCGAVSESVLLQS